MAIGSAFEAGGALDISAGGSVLASASMVELDFINYYDKTKSLIGFKTGGSYRSAEWNDWQISRSLISGRDVVVEAGLDLITHGAIFEASLFCAAD